MRVLRMVMATLAVAALAGAAPSCAGAPASDEPDRRARCPEGRDVEGLPCPRLVSWARHPDTGDCCRYEYACATPVGWKSYATEAACQEASRHD